ncbi:hypothetical protein FM119_08600 [Mycetocola reblochoni REB411]|uniref:Uncharacterized protein n=2 Tax=Mycetocola reblochoni TaxID=331618 RepID=A0A1R4JPE2_9MICO|nr:hypothetical protein FM119_08600 [Mycetocola reblochoni REB411]
MLQQLRNDRPSFEFRDQLRGVPDVALLDELLWRALRVRAADVGGGPEGENVHFLHSRDASPEIPSSGIAAMKGEKTMDEPWAE